MHVLNAGKSSEYFDSLVNEREDGAVSVIHGAWLEHSSSVGRSEHLEPASPLDMLVLYRAAAATFRDWTPGIPHEELAQGEHVLNRERVEERLLSITDPQLAALTTRFANRVMVLSSNAAAAQDLAYYVELFLRSLEDKRVIVGILNGSISRHSRELGDPDLW
jgi:hypothetical protein